MQMMVMQHERDVEKMNDTIEQAQYEVESTMEALAVAIRVRESSWP